MQPVQLFSPSSVYRYVARAAAAKTSKLEDRRASDFKLSGGTSFGNRGPLYGALFRSTRPPPHTVDTLGLRLIARMRMRWPHAGVGALFLAALSTAAFAALAVASAGPVDRPFSGGAISQLAINDGPTQGSFANVSYQHDSCGAKPGETICTWQLDVGLAPEDFELCPATLEAARMIWSSGEQTADGAVASGPKTFALRGSPGQALCVVLSQTASGEEAGEKYKDSSSVALLSIRIDDFLVGPIEAAELRVIRANPPAVVGPPPTPTPFFVGPGCRSLTIGATRYAFLYKQIDCYKATNLAKMVHVSGGSDPSGYRCREKAAGGMRCSRKGHPRKYVEWRLPDRRQRPR